jgi:hypothetical protein
MSTPHIVESKYPSQTTLIAEFGFNKYQLADKMRNNFHIHDIYLGGLEVYQVMHTTGIVLRAALFDGTILFREKPFAVIFHNCLPVAAKRAKEVRLSFRAAKDCFQLEPIVLVQIVDIGTERRKHTNTEKCNDND